MANPHTYPADTDDLRTRVAAALRDWYGRNAVVCEHTQLVDHGGAADAVIALLLDEAESRVLAAFTGAAPKLRGTPADLTEFVMHAIREDDDAQVIDPDLCVGCGEWADELWLDPRPRHPDEPQAQFCRDCASERGFDLGDPPTPPA